MMKLLLSLIVVLVFTHSLNAQLMVPFRMWEYTHPAVLAGKTYYLGKKISYSEKLNGVFVSVENSDKLATMMLLDLEGNLINIITNGYENVHIDNKLQINQSNLNKYAHVFTEGDSKTGYPTQVNVWIDSNGNANRMMSLGYDVEKNTRRINNIDESLTEFYPYTTITAPPKTNTFYSIDTLLQFIGNDSVVVTTTLKEFENSGTLVRRNDSLISFTYSSKNFKQIPYAKAVTFTDSNTYYILHAPDTMYRGNKDMSIRITQHRKDFTVDTVHRTYYGHFLFEPLPFPPTNEHWQKKFVPKAFSVAKNGYALVGDALDSNGKSKPLLFTFRFNPFSLSSRMGGYGGVITSCRYDDEGGFVAVGFFPNGKEGSKDFYMATVLKDKWGEFRLEEYVWGSSFDEELTDVTFVEDGGIIVSGNIKNDCYIARIFTGDVTSVGESVPFSSTIGFAPNPASSQTLVRFIPTTDGNATAELYDMRGMKVKELFSEQVQRGNEYTFPAPVADVPNGVYTVIITNGITKHHQQLQVIR
jgi:hypothetical protein